METISAWGVGADSDSDGYFSDPETFCGPFDPLYFDAILSWEYETIRALRNEENLQELDWLIRLMTICEPYPVEGLIPMDQAYPFGPEAIESYMYFLIDPQADIYEYDEEYYVGPEACYGFSDKDFIYLDEDPGLALGMHPGLHRILFP